MPRLLRSGLGLTALAFALVAADLAAKEQWVKVVAPQFTIYGSARSSEVLRSAEEFQEFIGALGEIVHVDPRNLPPLTIVMFGREKEFRPFRPLRPNGQPWDVDGFFSRQETWAVFGLTEAAMDEELRRTVFHEGVHWFLSGFELPNPPWLEEGLAEVFSTFVTRKNQLEWGQPIGDHVGLLRSGNTLPLERLLGVPRTDPLFNEDQRTGIFYAESWAFVHYLLFGQHDKGREIFRDYLRAYRTGVHPDEAFRTAFKASYGEMDRDLAKYVRSGQYYLGRRPLGAAKSGLKTEPASDLERELALARLAIGAQREEEAQKHIAAARQLAGPDTLAVSEVAGYAADARGDTAGMLAAFAEAAQHGSRDYRVYFALAANESQELSGAMDVSPADARRIAAGFKQAIKLRPWFLPAYQGLAGIVDPLGRENTEERDLLNQGWQQYPQDGLIQLGLAVAAQRAGAGEEARRWLAGVLAAAAKHPAAVNARARDLEAHWSYDTDTAEIQALVAGEHFEDALAKVDLLLTKGLPSMARSSVLFNRSNLMVQIQTKQARMAWSEHRWADARKLYELVKASAIPSGARNEAVHRLADLDRRNLGRE